MIETRSASAAARPSSDFDALAAAARRAVRGRRAQHEALNNDIATLCVLYQAYANIADGMHVSVLTAADENPPGA